VWAGRPAKLLRKLEPDEAAFITVSAQNYASVAALHAAENAKTFAEIELDKVGPVQQ
jgi:gamma-carbonic anhydrase